MPDDSTGIAGAGAITLTLRAQRLGWEAEGVLSLTLVAADGAALPGFAPGAHIDLRLPDGTLRQYSLCGDPAGGAWRIAVREVPGGRGSGFIHRVLRPGALLGASQPRNNFPLLPSPRYLFIAGGIGITPLLPMLDAARRAGAAARLLYCVRDAAQAPFLQELAPLGAALTLHAPANRLDIAAALHAVPADTLLYCCGPERLMLAVEAATAHWPAGNVHFEWFAPRSLPDDGADGGFELVCAVAGRSLRVAEGESVLAALRAAGIEVASSCEQGVCGTCEVRVVEGAVAHRDSILSASERAAGEVMMACVSRAAGRRLVLDL